MLTSQYLLYLLKNRTPPPPPNKKNKDLFTPYIALNREESVYALGGTEANKDMFSSFLSRSTEMESSDGLVANP